VNAVPVAFVASAAQSGGTERYLGMLLDGLGREWVRSVIFLEDGPLVDALRTHGHSTEVLPTSKRATDILASAWRLRKVLRRTRPKVLHADNLKAALVSVLATPGSEIPVVWVKHDFSWDGRLARLIGRRCEAVIGVSSAVTSTFDDRTRTKVRVIYNGLPAIEIDRDAGRRLMLSALGPPAPSTIVALVGRIHPAKGHRELLAVAPVLREHFPDGRVVFVGGEDRAQLAYASALRREVAEAGLDDFVTFLGHRGDAVSLIGGCDLVVIPTVESPPGFGREGFSYVGLEALAAGTPVVGYDHGGLPEVLGDCGRLVPPGDRPALAGAVIRVLEDGELRRRMARCGCERAASLFTLTRTIEDTRQCYTEVARSR
jgi:glycosyltransferase involved in cell wall biosynthesis